MNQHFTIIGSARGLPRQTVTAGELDERLGLDPGWTLRHTGIRTRHQSSGPLETQELARDVCFFALEDARKELADIDLIVDASLCIQQPIPCNAALLQKVLGPEASGIPCIDVHASCLGFLAALNVVNGLCASGSAKRVLIVCSEAPHLGVNWSQPESACLMGDGAAAFVVEASQRSNRCAFLMETFSEGAHLCEIRGGGTRMPSSTYSSEKRGDFLFNMDGKTIHRLASKRMPALLRKVLEDAGRSLDELNIVPHQASGPALEFMRRRLGLREEQFHVTIADHGNMVAAGIPYVLDAIRRKLPSGAPILLLGTAAGYTQAAAIFEL